MNFLIKQCELSDSRNYTDHCIFHMMEKGIDGIYAHPFPSSHPWDKEDFHQKLIQKWTLESFSPNWETAWVAIIGNKMVGHLNLRCGSIEAAKHRMRLGMGIETPYRSIGIGKALMNAAIQWANDQHPISWIDLSVFSQNKAAIKLYQGSGFTTAYVIEDALRIEGTSVDDIQMSLKL